MYSALVLKTNFVYRRCIQKNSILHNTTIDFVLAVTAAFSETLQIRETQTKTRYQNTLDSHPFPIHGLNNN